MTYAEKLKSPRWQKKRLEIFQRDEWTCQFCGDKESQLSVHHILYKKDCDPWEYHNDYLITVCDSCHAEEEKLKDESDFVLGRLLMSGLGRRDLLAMATELRRYLRNDRTAKFQKLMDYLYE